MKRVELVVTVADAGDFDLAVTEIFALDVPDHFSAGHACREALRIFKASVALAEARLADD